MHRHSPLPNVLNTKTRTRFIFTTFVLAVHNTCSLLHLKLLFKQRILSIFLVFPLTITLLLVRPTTIFRRRLKRSWLSYGPVSKFILAFDKNYVHLNSSTISEGLQNASYADAEKSPAVVPLLHWRTLVTMRLTSKAPKMVDASSVDRTASTFCPTPAPLLSGFKILKNIVSKPAISSRASATSCLLTYSSCYRKVVFL